MIIKLSLYVIGVVAGINSRIAEFFLDTEQTVVFGNAFASAGSAGLYLTRVKRDCEVGYGGVFGFARAVRNNCGVAGFVCHLYSVDGFGNGTDLVEFYKDGVGGAELDAFAETFGVGNE